VPQGSNGPFFAAVAPEDGLNEVLAVAKYPLGVPWKPPEAGVVEYVASRCAQAFGVNTPAPFLLKPDDWAVDELHRRFGLEIQRTYGFASKHLNGLRTLDDFLTPDGIFNLRHLISEEFGWPTVYDHTREVVNWAVSGMVRLLCFDLIALNSDRLPENPNAAVRLEGGIVAFDFGACFFTSGSSFRSIERSFSRSQIAERLEFHLLTNPVREILRLTLGANILEGASENLRHKLPPIIQDFRDISAHVKLGVQDETSKEIAGFFALFDEYLLFLDTDADRIVDTTLRELGSPL